MPRARATTPSGLSRVSQVVGAFRWAFMPLGLIALVAVGVHAAADAVDDRLRWGIEQFDAVADTFFARFELTRAWVDVVGSVERTHAARGLAFIWELVVDAAVALPALGYFEKAERDTLLNPRQTWRALLRRVREQPTPMRLIRPVVAAVFALAGAYAVARMVEGALFVALNAGVVADGLNGPVARICAASTMVVVLYSLGWRAVLRSLQHADEVCLDHHQRRAGPWLAGLWGSALALPLALAALLDTPFWSFFR